MRVIYKKSILEQIGQAKAEATASGREIEKIGVSESEMEQLIRELYLRPDLRGFGRVLGVLIEVECEVNGKKPCK